MAAVAAAAAMGIISFMLSRTFFHMFRCITTTTAASAAAAVIHCVCLEVAKQCVSSVQFCCLPLEIILATMPGTLSLSLSVSLNPFTYFLVFQIITFFARALCTVS